MTRNNLQPSLRRRGSGIRESGSVRMAGVMVIFEIVLTVLLLVGAGTLIRSMRHILSSPASTRVPATQVLTAEAWRFPPHLDDPARLVDRYRTIARQLHGDAGRRRCLGRQRDPGCGRRRDEYIAAEGSRVRRTDDGRTQVGNCAIRTSCPPMAGDASRDAFSRTEDRAGSMPWWSSTAHGDATVAGA